MGNATALPVKTRELHSHHFDSTIWNDLQFRDDDIIISTYAKSGTTWVQQIVAQMLFGGDSELPVADMSPWLDLRVPPKAVKLPRPMLHSKDFDFSFSGLKTAVLTTATAPGFAPEDRADLAAEFQAAAVEVLVAKAMAALRHCGLRQLVVAGGVGANLALRAALDAAAAKRKARVFYPELELCTDNGAMIAFAGAMRLMAGEQVEASDGRFAVRPRWSLQEITPPQAAA